MFSDCKGENGDETNSPLSFQALFEKLCPMYMFMGMSYREFYDGDPTLVIAYRKAYEMKKKHKNYMLWLQARYVYDAMCAVYPLFRFSFKGGELKPHEYLSEPYPTDEKEMAEMAERREKEAYEERLRQQQAHVAAMRAAGEKNA